MIRHYLLFGLLTLLFSSSLYGADWPMQRHAPARSGISDGQLQYPLQLRWALHWPKRNAVVGPDRRSRTTGLTTPRSWARRYSSVASITIPWWRSTRKRPPRNGDSMPRARCGSRRSSGEGRSTSVPTMAGSTVLAPPTAGSSGVSTARRVAANASTTSGSLRVGR